MQNKLFVRNLPFATEDAELQSLFSGFGDVVSARVATERDTGKGRGFAFVEMRNAEAAQQAIEGLEGTQFKGRTIHVAVSEPREAGPRTRNW
jgi:RNA recognition motif-containing protein